MGRTVYPSLAIGVPPPPNRTVKMFVRLARNEDYVLWGWWDEPRVAALSKEVSHSSTPATLAVHGSQSE